MADPTHPDPHPHPPADDDGGSRSGAGSNYGDFVPPQRQRTGRSDPSKGAELERDALPADADFSVPIAPHNPATT